MKHLFLLPILLMLPLDTVAAQSMLPHMGRLNQRMDAVDPESSAFLAPMNPDWVIIGKSGWLYYKEQQALEYFIGNSPFTQGELWTWKRILEERREWLAQRGIEYYIVIAPNKETIYPEFMPDNIVPSGNPSRMDQLVACLQQYSTFRIIDVRPALTLNKSTHRNYHLTDSHWNECGSLVAYREIMNALAPDFPGLTIRGFPDFTLRTVITPGLELAAFLGQTNQYQEEYLQLVPQHQRNATIEGTAGTGLTLDPDNGFPNYALLSEPLFATVCPTGEIPRGVMFRDSFAQPVMPFLSEHFQRMVYKVGAMRFDSELIKTEQPDVVISEMVERLLMFPAIENPDEVAWSLRTGVRAREWGAQR